jgi:protein phosphatase PTC7
MSSRPVTTAGLAVRFTQALRIQKIPHNGRLPLTFIRTKVTFVVPERTSPWARRTFAPPRSLTSTFTRALQSSSPTQPQYTYRLAASYTAKDIPYNPAKNVTAFNPYTRSSPHKDKSSRPASGQDAFFISRIGSSSDIALGVADGVGGWVDSGVDPADFSHGFCQYMSQAASKEAPTPVSKLLSARALMDKGYNDICDDPSVPAGGSTACVAIASSAGNVEVANLGDSGFVLLRANAIHALTEPQTHAFNTPYQLSIIPEHIRKRAAVFGGTQLCDLPKDSSITNHSVRHGDVLVFATDGVWDNLSAQDILRIVSKLMLASKAWETTKSGEVMVGSDLNAFTLMAGTEDDVDVPSLQSFLAVGIAGEAKGASINRTRDGPFAREVQKYYPSEGWRGGKVDDICVIVAVVVEEGK